MRKPGINYSRYFLSLHGQKQFMRPRHATAEQNTQETDFPVHLFLRHVLLCYIMLFHFLSKVLL